jgi:hypothetical protein
MKNFNKTLLNHSDYGKFGLNKKRYAIAINMHTPYILFGILTNPKNNYEITKLINSKASYPEPEPSIKTTVSENPLLGTRIVTEEVNREEEKKVDKQEDELDKHD